MALFDCYRRKKVLVTGDTGFKGAWLSLWLMELGADVYGFALPPETREWLYSRAALDSFIRHRDGDIRDAERVRQCIDESKPDIVFHLAAQSLVRPSYVDPVGTAATNFMGTVHILDALRRAGRPCAAVIVTSDKCYENREWPYAYRENDPMGGHDVYSMSKGAAELAVSSFRRSFFPPEGPIAVASARAGNVIGPGDWAVDRIVPDAMRALLNGEILLVRNPNAVRPWQHVLEPLAGYLQLGALLLQRGPVLAWVRDAWNFGPALDAARTVAELADEIIRVLGHGSWKAEKSGREPHEANFLRLSVEKASSLLGWRPVWSFREAVRRTVEGYQFLRSAGAADVRSYMAGEIRQYTLDAAAAGCRWAQAG
ncbi:MAG: CDP-glucose 4,6-dehydratase [Kiritimatiellae bacterium]|nr:CDP-glucose 4,6-dehydratase [Kiritimatiellia bacterium]MDW8459531.1 CDP-glucose 4,6-dehydratase [Verrucomicrobiota bacterium]